MDRFLGMNSHEFLLTDFSQCQKEGTYGDWYSIPFNSHVGGYHLKLNVETNQRGPRMTIRLCPEGNDQELEWPVTFAVTLYTATEPSEQSQSLLKGIQYQSTECNIFSFQTS